MSNLDRAFIDDLLSRIDIVEVIGNVVQLKKHGNGYKGLCPFHSENTPSFNVSNTKQFYHCFGCGASGDAIKFLREHDGLTFIEAIEKLAHMANIEIPKGNEIKSNNNSKILLDINNLVNQQYENNLKDDYIAKKYLLQRNINEEMIKIFNLGLSKDSWDNIAELLTKEKKIKEGIDLGLLVKNKDKVYDRFRNRIMFPIRNTSGNIIAFGGRALSKEDNAKYINSPESKLFYKSSELYGLFESKQYINKIDQIIVVEGYTDVIALHQNGIKNAVAALGTAFTKFHINKLLRYSKNIVFCFDGDTAGQKAAWKALVNCLPEIRDGVSIGFSFITDGKDPDELCNENVDIFKTIISKNTALSEFMFDNIRKNLDLDKVEDKTTFVKNITPLIESIPNGLYKKLLKEKLLNLTKLSETDLFSKEKDTTKSFVKNEVVLDELDLTDALILSIFLEHPILLSKFKKIIINLIKNNHVKEMLKLIEDMKINNTFQLNKFLEMDGVKKDLFLKYSSEKVMYKNVESAEQTINSIINNAEEKNQESQYFDILKKFSDGKDLTDSEKQILKNFKK
ncbi:MAG: DNA primase [Gammaproteobacteria bacterium]|jgi:DNA primase|nr:DNA primase [Gammaproteobacteria bacterium]MBT4462522.1 DNA primase [Gammaproteobacteria bacterium]MBT4654769.1 DNA primase [Gammaproteobacteria bacterium]MBT5116948.1 DNA primase [Gammaproteobacteria bacterium]MBT5761642.1 DNA primase [Gammaproteobacteria bacterium]